MKKAIKIITSKPLPTDNIIGTFKCLYSYRNNCNKYVYYFDVSGYDANFLKNWSEKDDCHYSEVETSETYVIYACSVLSKTNPVPTSSADKYDISLSNMKIVSLLHEPPTHKEVIEHLKNGMFRLNSYIVFKDTSEKETLHTIHRQMYRLYVEE